MILDNKHNAFTLIELLVVVAIIGIISAIGVVSYNGYKSSAAIKSAENSLSSIYLAQQEYKASAGTYYNAGCCSTSTTSNITNNLFNQVDNLSKQDFYFGNTVSGDTFRLTARKKDNSCTVVLDEKNNFSYSGSGKNSN